MTQIQEQEITAKKIMDIAGRQPPSYDGKQERDATAFLSARDAARDQSVAAEAVKPWREAVREIEGAIGRRGKPQLSHALGIIERLLSTPPVPAPTKDCEYCDASAADHKRPCGNCGDEGHAKWECVLPPEKKP